MEANSLRTFLLLTIRWALWLILGGAALRGILTTLYPAPAQPVAVAPARPALAPALDEGARAFAALFVREYLTWEAGDLAGRQRRLAPFLAAHLQPAADLKPGSGVRAQWATGVWPWGLEPQDPPEPLKPPDQSHQARVTVLAEVVATGPTGEDAPPRRVALVVPVALAGGGLVVTDYPAFVPPPAPGRWQVPAPAGRPLPGAEAPVRELLTGFFRAYTQGTPAELSYFLTPEARLAGLGGQFAFRELAEVQVLQTGDAAYQALVLAVLEDPATGAAYRQRFRVDLAHQNRWYVANLEQKGVWRP